MLETRTRTFASPGKYIQGPGELTNLVEYTSLFGDKVFALIDSFFYNNLRKKLQNNYNKTTSTLICKEFNGEVTEEEIKRVTEIAKEKNCNVVVGIGGGKTLDTAKAVAKNIEANIIISPTAASTDAPTSALSVVYTKEGEHSHEIFYDKNPDIVLLDTEIVAQAPVRLLVAGMGDALATYFEAKARDKSNTANFVGNGYQRTLASMAIAELAYKTLLADGEKAKLAAEANACTEALENIIEANTLLSGLGFESTGVAAAHGIHDGFTILEEVHHLYHGEKVAFGTIAQLVLENYSQEKIKEVIRFCNTVGLPTTLVDMGLNDIDREKIMDVAKEAAQSPLMEGEPFVVTADMIFSAILAADSLGQKYN